MKRLLTRWDGGDQYLECFEYSAATAAMAGGDGHATARRVVKCLFDGYHGSWLPGTNGEELTWWFMQQVLGQ